ncbi:hypothetical protein [Myxosarcina sp. GI1]|nr:hypothetical protein [Myxosarcina sp. GI1]
MRSIFILKRSRCRTALFFLLLFEEESLTFPSPYHPIPDRPKQS